MKQLAALGLALSIMLFAGCSGEQKKDEQTASVKKVEKVEKSDSLSKTESDTRTDSKFHEESKSLPVEQSEEVKLTPPTMEDVGSPDEVAILATSKGDIVVEFYPEDAPMHVANFKKLSLSGFFDGTYFHRVLPGFVVQGGDPNTKDDNPRNDGLGGPPWNVDAEFNARLHDKGILSMARSTDINSAGSQFFICLSRERTKSLDNQYTVFGNVINGLDVVESIGRMKRDPQNPEDRKNPGVTLESVRIVKKSELEL